MKRFLPKAAAAASLAAALILLPNSARAERPFSWTGFYWGANTSMNFSQFKTTSPTTPDQSGDGWGGGLQAGYSWQGGPIVAGVELDANFADISSRTLDGNFITEDTKIQAFGSARGRLGFSTGGIMPYVTGGLAWAHVKSGQHCAPNATAGFCLTNGGFDNYDAGFQTGWTVGGGVEAMVWRNISIKVEYLHADFGSKTWNFGTTPKGNPTGLTPHTATMDTLRMGFNYRF